jgi:hypothetical protein
VCDQWSQCIDPLIIDNFATCLNALPMVSSRAGAWYAFAAPDVTQAFAVSSPGAAWLDQGCAAWTSGGGITIDTDFAGMGVSLNNSSTYSVASYTGVTIQIETSESVLFTLKLLNGYEFGATLPGATGAPVYNVPFDELTPDLNQGTPDDAFLDLTQVTDMEFDASDPGSFGIAVHLLALY